MANVTDEIVELRGLRFHYRDWSCKNSDAPVLVLLHGYTGHARSWDAFAQAISHKYRVLALDQRGHGESQWAPADRYGTDEMVADLSTFVHALDLNHFTLLGLSMGGLVSIAYASSQPKELAKLVIVDIAPAIARAGLLKIQSNVSRSDCFASKEEAFERARQDNPIPPEDHLRARVYANLMRTEDGQWTYRYDRALRDSGVPRARYTEEEGWAQVASISVPTLLIRGETSDILDVDIAQHMIATLVDGQLAEVGGAGHPVPLDQPEGFLQAVQTFL